MGRKANTKAGVWKHIKKGAENECWEWQKKLSHHGYGEYSIKHKSYRAHRIVFELTHPEIKLRPISQLKPKVGDQLILHSCDNPSCCNPKHLFLGTHKENMEDMVKKGRRHNFNGEQGQNAKLTNREAAEIRKLSHQGVPQKEIAKRFGVSVPTVSGIKWNRVYRNV